MIRIIQTISISLLFIHICYSQPTTTEKSIFIAGSQVVLNGDEQCEKFIITQAIEKETAMNIWSSKELIFINNELDHVVDIEEGIKHERDLKDNEKSFDFFAVETHSIYAIEDVLNSDSYIGGSPPRKFGFPEIHLKASFQYIGKLSKSANGINWLPFDLHIIAPVFLKFDKIFLDYSDPHNPTVINEEELQKANTIYDEINPESEIFYRKTPIKFRDTDDFGYDIGHGGVPNWILNPEIPNCPKSGRVMKFVCQLKSESGIETESTNILTENESMPDYTEILNFRGDGDLFIFFEPKSKVLCLFIQKNK
jgi:hypothetical protein